MFDSREYLQTLELPTFTAADGTVFTGRILSMDQWQPYEVRMGAAGRGELEWPALRILIRDLTSAFFPRGWRIWTRRWWRPAWWYVNRLPPVGQMRAVWDFMRTQGRALGLEPEMPHLGTRKMLGLDPVTPSAGSTPAS